MSVLDVFKNDIFGVVSLTAAIDKLPYVPSRLEPVFSEEGVTTTAVFIEEKFGKLSVIPTAARGAMPNAATATRRRAKSFAVPHIPLNSAIMADDVQGVRAFGSETEIEVFSSMVNDKLASMKQDLEVTKEWHRIGAIQGVVYDADGTSVIYDWFQEFGISQHSVAFDFADTDENSVKLKAAEVRRHIEDSLGATPYGSIRALCGKDIFDSLTTCAEVKKAYDRYQESSFLRTSQARGSFEYADITWEEYRGSIGNTPFIPDNQIRFFPEGVKDIFKIVYAPADFIEAVNTKGKPVYAKQKVMDWDKGVELHVQSNPLVICTRPSVLVLGYDEAEGSE